MPQPPLVELLNRRKNHFYDFGLYSNKKDKKKKQAACSCFLPEAETETSAIQLRNLWLPAEIRELCENFWQRVCFKLNKIA